MSTRLENRIKNLISKGERKKASKLIEDAIDIGEQFTEVELLQFILEPSGMTVAHKLALQGISFDNSTILSLKGEDRSSNNIAFGHNGCSVAFILAKKGLQFIEPEIQTLGSEDGRSTVAHAMAEQGHKFSNKEILTLKDDQGMTVAHVMAKCGHSFTDKEILELETPFGFTVESFQKEV